MTKEQANEMKNVIKREGAFFERNFAYYDKAREELRIKVSGYNKAESENELNFRMLKVLGALYRNGFRNKYRKEQRFVTNNYGRFDCRYLVFK